MKTKASVILAGALSALILLLGWFLGIGPQVATVSETNTKRISIERENVAGEAQLIRLKRDYLNIGALQAQLAGLKSSVPAAAAMPRFVSELNSLASLNEVVVKSISVSDARPYLASAPTAAGSSGRAPSPTITNTRITASNFVLIPVQFSISGDYAKILNFLHDVQNGERLFLVSTFSSAGVTDTKAALTKSLGAQLVDSTVGGFVYVILSQ